MGIAGVTDRGARMSFDPLDRVRLTRSGLDVTRLGFGTAEIGGLFRPVSDADAAKVLDHAWSLGIRYFDTAPLYGQGDSERRLGALLSMRPRDSFVVSTKVGRLLFPRADVPPGADGDPQPLYKHVDSAGRETTPPEVVFDFSRDGVLRSVEASLRRLGLERIDILYIHDPDDHWQEAIDGAYPALTQLRAEGVVRAIGAGMNQAEMLARFAREGDFDVFLLAGRYTLLDHSALPELLPLCVEREVSIVAGGLMNSGLLADPRPGATFNYTPAPAHLVDRAQRLRAVCERHGVPLRAAAIQFPLAHPAVKAIVAGVRTVEHLDDYPRYMAQPLPPELWSDLREEGLIPSEAPTPG
jgi:D-threo-aldose 1-dehydrogenase